MPSAKRVRPPDGTDEEVEVLESASSQLRASHKRPHISPPETHGTNSRESTFFDENNPPSTQFQQHASILEEYERARDEVSLAPSDVDEAYYQQLLDDRMQRPLASDLENVGAEQGILESVVCKDFMCHKNLKVQFGPLINFIIGHNGSGKSAVLTAVTLCLGGKATSTNRGQNLKGFIREGADQSILEVKIKNRGTDAYCRDLYGDSIIVERHFNTLGTSGFKLKSKDGRIISTKRSELDVICDFYALQLDNPVNVLTQDMARSFLNSSTPSDKYKFFIKGVQLEQLDQDYCLLGSSLDSVDAQLAYCQEDCSRLREAKDQAKQKHDLAKKQCSLRERVESLRRQFVWAQVEAQEKSVEDCNRGVDQKERRVAMIEGEVESLSQQYDETVRTFEEAEKAVTTLQEEKVPLEEQQVEAKERFDSVKDHLRTLLGEERTMRADLKKYTATCAEHESNIRAEHERLDAAHGGAEAEKRAEISDAEETLRAAKDEKVEHEDKLPRLYAEKEQAESMLKSANARTSSRRTDFERGNARLRALQNPNQRDEWAAFRPNTERLVKAIAHDNGFKEKPVGPIGRHIRLLNPKFSSIVHTFFGGSLQSFVVSSKEDHSRLAKIMKSVKCDCSIIITSSRPINNIREPASHQTILKILEIREPLIRNALIINNAIDQTALFEINSEARDLANASRMPDNVKSMIACHPHVPGQGIRYVLSAGGRQSQPVKAYKGLSKITMSDGDAISLQTETVEEARRQLFSAEQDETACQSRKKDANQAINAHIKRGKEIKLHLDRSEDHVNQLNNELDAMRPQDGHLEFLRSELEQSKMQVEHFKTQIDEASRVKEEVAQSNTKNKAEMDRMQALLVEKDAAILKAEQVKQTWRGNKTTQLRAKHDIEARLKDVEADKNAAVEEHRQEVALLADWEIKARSVSERVSIDEGETVASIEKKYDSVVKQRERAEAAMGGTEQELTDAFKRATELHKEAELAFDNAKKTNNMLMSALRDRRDKWKTFRTFIAIRAKSEFEVLLRERAFTGKMHVDHANKVLDLKIEPDATRRTSTSRSSAGGNGAPGEGRQTKTLSGGEKSFSTICMLLALWEAMGSPIRCLDEFDVFMDSVNRDISMRMMIAAARQSVGKQYILITPQAMGSLKLGNDVKIIKLNDPERGQTVLDMPAAA